MKQFIIKPNHSISSIIGIHTNLQKDMEQYKLGIKKEIKWIEDNIDTCKSVIMSYNDPKITLEQQEIIKELERKLDKIHQNA